MGRTDLDLLKTQVADLYKKLRLGALDTGWSGCGSVWRILEKMADDGACVLVKIDGQRKAQKDAGRYTVVISGGDLGEDFFRLDCADLDEALAKGVLFYSVKCWSDT